MNDGAVFDAAELDARLDALHSRWEHAGYPLFATISVGEVEVESHTLYVALGRPWSTVAYEVGVAYTFSLWDSVGDATLVPEADRDGDELTLSIAGAQGEFTWMSAAGAVPVAQAREAAREFFATGERPLSLAWHEI